MWYKIFFLPVFVLITGCLSNYKLAVEAESNRAEMSETYVGMCKPEFLNIMGNPDRKEKRRIDCKTYIILFYITKEAQFYQSELLDRNFTPFVFYKEKLIGKGYGFYNHLFDINNARSKKQDEDRQAYTDDLDEWPPNEHTILDFSEEDKDLEKILNESIEPKSYEEKAPLQEGQEENKNLEKTTPIKEAQEIEKIIPKEEKN